MNLLDFASFLGNVEFYKFYETKHKTLDNHLYYASVLNHFELLKYLISKGYDKYDRDTLDKTKNPEIIKYLKKHGKLIL